jgi:DNA-binding transcriptional regulator LsrR (DeoR family)
MTTETATTTLAGQVARLFFERQLTKTEIASRLGISRFRVARLIDQALADGVVRIEFRDAPDQDLPLARAVEERFGLDLCVVAGGDAGDPMAAVARLAGDVVDGLLGTGEAIGIAWGTTVARVVDAMPARSDPSIDVVQLAGSSTSLDAATDPGDLTRVLAARLGGRAHRIHAPAFVESAELRAALVREPEVAATVARFDDLAIALVGIGSFGSAGTASGKASGVASSSSLLRSGALSATDIARLAELGAVGDLVVHPFDAGGRFVAREIAERAVAIDIERLRRVPRVVAVAAGREKVAAIRAALATDVIRVLVTDAATASGLVATERPGTAAAGGRRRR